MKNSGYWLVGILAGIGGFMLGQTVTARAFARLTPEQLRSLADAKVRAGVPS